jgi:hypothetical protein
MADIERVSKDDRGAVSMAHGPGGWDAWSGGGKRNFGVADWSLGPSA